MAPGSCMFTEAMQSQMIRSYRNANTATEAVLHAHMHLKTRAGMQKHQSNIYRVKLHSYRKQTQTLNL